MTKYLTEVTTAIVEIKLKVTDIPAIVELCSLLNQRYSDFSQPFLEAWSKTLTIKKDDKNFNVSKLRVDLRLYCDLVSVGIFPLKDGLSLLGNVLTTLIANDKVHEVFNRKGNVTVEAHTSVILAPFYKWGGDSRPLVR